MPLSNARPARLFLYATTACTIFGHALAEPAPAPFRVVGEADAAAGAAEAMSARSAEGVREIEVPDAEWLQIRFAEWDLGDGSITITDLETGETQTFTQDSLDAWEGRSAVFDGNRLEITSEAGADASYVIDEIVVGEPEPSVERLSLPGAEESGAAIESLCGSDNRTASNDVRVGRIMPIGCTGWIVGANTILTAGHCIAASTDMLQFNVPASDADGTTNNPGVADQYPIVSSSIVHFDDGNGAIGNDWAVFSVAPNTQTGLLPFRAQGQRFRISNTATPATVRVTGYGLDGGTANQTQQTDTGAFLPVDVQGDDDVVIEYTVDTRGGNSGGPVIVEPGGIAVGIHTNAGCAPPNNGNHGTGFQHETLWQTIGTFEPSHDIVWQRRDGQVHYWPMESGVRQGGLHVHTPVGARWHLAGAGDVTGDGVDDIVWQRRDGQVHFWPMWNGERQGGVNVHTPVGARWTLAAVGDVDGNGTDDIVWQRRDGQVHYWPMANGQRQGGINIHSPVGARWTLAGAGDVDGDGTDDIVWQRRDGQVHYWPMTDGVRQGGVNIHTPVGAQWTLADIGDVDGDGTDDIVWQHRNGQVHYWQMLNGVRQGGINIHTPVGARWTLAAVADID